MKTHLENIGYPVRLGIENIQLETPEEDNNIKVVDFYENVEKQQFIITLYSRMFADSSVRIVLKEDKVFIVVSEVVDMAFSSVFVSDWQGYTQQKYTRFHNVSLLLPGDNFYLLKHFVVSENYLLKIFLGRLVDN